MKKTAIIVTVVLLVTVLTVLVSAAGRTRKLDTDYELNFEGNTAICTAIVTGETKSDFVQVTMRLKRENTVLRTWYREGYFQVAAEETCGSLTGGEVYTLEIIAKINGEIQPAMSTSRACPGGTTPTTQPTVPPTTHPTVPPTIHPTIPPTQPTVLPLQPTVPPTTPVTPGLANTGYMFVYKGENPFLGMNPDLSGCKFGCFYWVDKTTWEVTLISDEAISDYTAEGAFVYYVKTAEPTKVYRADIADFSQYKVIYESAHGKVSDMLIDTVIIREQLVLQFVADDMKFVILDLNTGEDTVLTEQYYIQTAMFDHGSASTWEGLTDFVFWGKLDENDTLQSYRYFIQTGEIREEGECAD